MKLENYMINFSSKLTWKNIYTIREQLSGYNEKTERLFQTLNLIVEELIISLEIEINTEDKITSKKIINKNEIYNFIIEEKNTKEEELYKIIKESLNLVKKK